MHLIKEKNKVMYLNNAKKNIDDEFYTLYEDIDQLLSNSKIIDKFKNKTILLPCDTSESNFVKWFLNNKQLNCNIIYEYGNFKESIEKHIDHIDMVITNPPFSQNKDFIALIEKYKSRIDFLFVNALLFCENKKVIKWIINGEMFSNDLTLKKFKGISGEIKQSPCKWYATFELPQTIKMSRRSHDLIEYKNQKILLINKLEELVLDCVKNFKGIIAAPVTILHNWNLQKMEFIDKKDDILYNNKKIFARILFKWR